MRRFDQGVALVSAAAAIALAVLPFLAIAGPLGCYWNSTSQSCQDGQNACQGIGGSCELVQPTYCYCRTE